MLIDNNSGLKCIPIELCSYALKERKINMVKVYLYLKYSSDGYLTMKKGFLKRHSEELGLSIPTFRKQIQALVKSGWITVNGKRKAYRVIGYKPLATKLGFTSYQAVHVEKMEFGSFKAFIIGAVVTYWMKYLRKNKGRSVYKKGCTKTNLPSLSPFILPNNYLAKVLGVSLSTACEYKRIAEQQGYLKTTAQLEPLNIPNPSLWAYLEMTQVLPRTIRRKRGHLFVQKPDRIESNLELGRKNSLKKHLKKQKKIRYYNKGANGGETIRGT